jgi:multidrug resistance efflux pump
MIKSLRKRVRPDNLKNQVRAGGQTFARKLYFYCVVASFGLIAWTFTGHWFFMDAEGMVTKERTIIAPDYAARVLAIHVKPGDVVKPGTHIATLQSREILDTLTELTTRRSTVLSREAQISGRVETIRKVLPSAVDRRKRAAESQAHMSSLIARGLTTSVRVQEAQREFYDAQREESSMANELAALDIELKNITSSRVEVDGLIKQVQESYNGGKVVSAIDGTVGAKVPSLGHIVKSGEPLVELYRGDMFVLAYMPVGRLYSLKANDAVRVSDGQNNYPGRIERIETVTDALPPEFLATFRTADRQQLFRVVFEGPTPFAIQSKIRVSGNWSPQGLMTLGKGLAIGAGETVSGWFRFGNGPETTASK